VTELTPMATRARAASRSKQRAAWGLAVLSALSFAGNAKAAPPSGEQSEQAFSTKPTLPEVTVRAQREAMERRVWAFVTSGIRKPFEASLSRWNNPICPLVVGLPQEEDRFFRARLSEIAVAAGAHLAPQPCQANFAVIVAAEPDAVLKAWYKRDYHLFGDATENRINEWLKRSRPVRVWYNVESGSASGLPYSPWIAGSFGQGFGVDNTAVPVDNNVEASHIVFNAVRDFSSVIVAIDSARTEGTSLNTLADYAAMVGLAEIQSDADFGEVPTILRLFSSSEGAKPTNLSDWDTALLTALYKTGQEYRYQRSEIIQSMVNHLAP
jgi:hypothetical protein